MEQKEINEAKHMHRPSPVLLSMDKKNYSEQLQHVIGNFMDSKSGDAVYITFNKPAHNLIDIFGEADCKSRLLFLDAVSAHAGEARDIENAFFIQFPGDLTSLMLVLSRTLRMHDLKFLFLDSVPTVLLYNDEKTTTRFLYAVSSICKQHSVRLVMFSSNEVTGTLANSLSSIATPQELGSITEA